MRNALRLGEKKPVLTNDAALAEGESRRKNLLSKALLSKRETSLFFFFSPSVLLFAVCCRCSGFYHSVEVERFLFLGVCESTADHCAAGVNLGAFTGREFWNQSKTWELALMLQLI